MGGHRAGNRRALPSASPHRPWCHGGSLACPRSAPGPRRGGQGSPDRRHPHRRRTGQRVPADAARGQDRRPAQPPGGGHRLRRGRGRRPPVDRHAAGTRAVPGPGARGLGAAVAAAGRRDGPAAAVRAERGARGRGDAPGRQAEQRAARQRRPGRADRLRHRHLPGRPQAHPDRHGDGLARVHRTRADPRRGRVPRLRPVVARRDRLRGGRGPRPLREARRRDHHHVRHHQRGGARGAHGGRARPGHRRAAPPRARGPAGRERGRADDHRRAAAADRPDSGHVGRLRAHRALRVVPADPAPPGVSAARIGAARVVGAARIGAARVGPPGSAPPGGTGRGRFSRARPRWISPRPSRR